MNTTEDNDYQKWLARLDAVKTKYGITTDAELAIFLDVSKQRLQQLRSATGKKVPFEVKFQIWNLEGMTGITEAIWDLLPEDKAKVFKKRHDELSRRLRMKNKAKH